MRFFSDQLYEFENTFYQMKRDRVQSKNKHLTVIAANVYMYMYVVRDNKLSTAANDTGQTARARSKV